MGSAQCMRALTAAGIEKSLGDVVHVCDVVVCVCVCVILYVLLILRALGYNSSNYHLTGTIPTNVYNI